MHTLHKCVAYCSNVEMWEGGGICKYYNKSIITVRHSSEGICDVNIAPKFGNKVFLYALFAELRILPFRSANARGYGAVWAIDTPAACRCRKKFFKIAVVFFSCVLA